MKVYYDNDTDLDLIKKKICIIGYGSQGHAHALNLRDSGVNDVIIALRPDSKSVNKAKSEGFEVMNVENAAKVSDLCMVLVPDELQADLYNNYLRENLKNGSFTFVCSWTCNSLSTYQTKRRLRCIYDSSEGPGHTVRGQYVSGAGVPCLIAIHQDASGKALDHGLSYASAIGGVGQE